ncbi:hypothetical protein JS578_13420 (plasmid) [Dysgonomonadaceae bacterium zrk40]|nr:hypothetical protein JS578_13420 [Dysgonomonadaceae bacterium zrk40]
MLRPVAGFYAAVDKGTGSIVQGPSCRRRRNEATTAPESNSHDPGAMCRAGVDHDRLDGVSARDYYSTMFVLASYIMRIVAVVTVVLSMTAMSWAQMSGDGSLVQHHKAHQVSADATVSMTGHGPENKKTGLHHNTLCATACALAGTFPTALDFNYPLSLELKSTPFNDIGRPAFGPEPGRRPPKSNPILA